MMEGQRLTLVFEIGASSTAVARSVLRGLRSEKASNVNGRTLSVGDVLKMVDVDEDPSLELTAPGFSFLQSRVGHRAVDVIYVDSNAIFGVEWESWVVAFAAVYPLVSAWVVDRQYDYWQNADDPIEYEAAGKSYSHLPMRSNGLPPPLTKTIIDTSQNPGRRTFRQGYIEGIGAIMWLGARFWRVAGADPKKTLSQNWVRIEQIQPSLMQLLVADDVFREAEGDEAVLQHRLRQLLFPSS